jgi:glycosyltransferase involved in cell wall biosynthesis
VSEPRALTTVIMPAYRSEAYIRDAVESALAQTESRLEIIVVDDHGPVPAAESLADIDDPRLTVVRHRRNRGSYAARNTALTLVRTPFVSQLDPDDTWEPRYLEFVLPCFEDPRVGLVYSNTHIVGHPQGHDDYIGTSIFHPLDRFPQFAELCPVPALTATFRTDALRGVGGYPNWLYGAGDWYVYARLIKAGWRFAYVHRQLARYRWPSPASGKSFDRKRVERAELAMWTAFALRHPFTRGPWRQIRLRALREVDYWLGTARRQVAGYPPAP